MRVFLSPEGDKVKLTEAESKILDAFSIMAAWEDKAWCILALKHFGNAEKVLRVLELNGGINRKHVSYTLYPIITGIGDRSPEQYVEDVERAEREFREQWFREHPDIARLYQFRKLKAAGRLIVYRAMMALLKSLPTVQQPTLL